MGCTDMALRKVAGLASERPRCRTFNPVLYRGAAARLQAVLNMGPLSQYPADPNAVLPFRTTSGDTTLTLLGHQAGHLFLAYVSVPDPSNPQGHPMSGRIGTHWSFLYDSEASLMEGNRIVDNGTSAKPRFTTTAAVQGYSPLDQYLMGFRLPEEVPNTFWVANPSMGISPTQSPQAGVSFDGDRRDVKIQDIVTAAGRRTPDATVAQRNFRFAFVLIVPEGHAPDPIQLAQLDTDRVQFEAAFGTYTSGRASADTTLKKALHVSIAPAAGVLVGGSMSATLTLEQPAASTLNVAITPNSDAVSIASPVPIPKGAMTVSFAIAGVSAGVVQITATPADSSYETAFVNVQVSPPPSLQLGLISGDQQSALPGTLLPVPIVVKLTDINGLVYSGVHLKATTTSGTVQTESVTDDTGSAGFTWTLGFGCLGHHRLFP